MTLLYFIKSSQSGMGYEVEGWSLGKPSFRGFKWDHILGCKSVKKTFFCKK